SSEAIVTAVQKGKEIKSDRIDSEDGSYRIEGLEGGVYDLVVSAHRYYENSSLRGITVIAFENSADHNITLKEKPLGSISGRITPASVRVFITASRGSLRDGSDLADEDGNYKIEDLMKGTYILVAEADGFSPGFIWAVEVTAGKDTGGQDITLKPLSTVGSISGVITPPLARARVHVLQNGEEITVELTNDDGSYHIWNLKEGLYDLEVTSAYGYYSDTSMVDIEVVAGEESPDHNVTLTLIPTGSISGKITPLFPGKDIWFTLKGEFGSSFSTNPDSEYKINPENGHYVIEEVEEGIYDLVIEETVYYSEYLLKDIVVVAGQDSPNHDVVLTPKPARGSISGTVSPASSNAIVTFYKAGEIIDWVEDKIDPTDGNYSSGFLLEPGIYDLEVTAEKGYQRNTSLKGIEVISGEDSSGNNITLVKPSLPVGSNSLHTGKGYMYFSLKEGGAIYDPQYDFALGMESPEIPIIKVAEWFDTAGVIDLGPIHMTEVTTVPLDGYAVKIPIIEQHSYAIRTPDGHYGVIYSAHLVVRKGSVLQGNYRVLYFDWVYQPDGTRSFYW
ncbi:MAG: carboxypeptidase-like regulatory domain-containing protein, partial [bacterium]